MKQKKSLVALVALGGLVLSSPFWETEFRARKIPQQAVQNTAREPIVDTVQESLLADAQKSEITPDTLQPFFPADSAHTAPPVGLPSESTLEAFNQATVRSHVPGEFFRNLQQHLRERFQQPSPRFKSHKSCQKQEQQLLRSFRESIQKTQLSGESLVPETGAILDLNFYFQHNDKYYQLSMEPSNRQLDEYRISLIQSLSQDFTQETIRIEDGRMSQLNKLTRMDAITNLKSLIEDYTAQGARWGTRTVLLASLEKKPGTQFIDKKKSTMVEFHNGAVQGFMNSQQECHLANENVLECVCW